MKGFDIDNAILKLQNYSTGSDMNNVQDPDGLSIKNRIANFLGWIETH